MPTPIERLEARKQLQDCRVCAWLATLDDKERRGWAEALGNPRYGNTLVASIITEDIGTSEYVGPPIGESSVETHRRRAHR